MDDMDFNTISEPVAAHESELLAMTEAPTAIASTAADASGGEAATGVDAMMGDAATGDASKTKRQLLSCTSCRKRKVKVGYAFDGRSIQSATADNVSPSVTGSIPARPAAAEGIPRSASSSPRKRRTTSPSHSRTRFAS